MTAVAGFFGKIPSRGDFVRHGLSPGFLRALDGWWQVVLPDSRERLGEGWADVWMEAPVWRFALAPGTCGEAAALGLWLPSTDRAGRLFPLTIAAVAPNWADLARLDPFLAAAATIGFRVLEEDVEPAELGRAVDAALAGAGPGERLGTPPPAGGLWWTEGSPLVAPATRRLPAMPDGAAFAAMLRDAA